jgi:glycosyltransferase involved in cell wall biosynthesis
VEENRNATVARRVLLISEVQYGALPWSLARAFESLGCKVDYVDCIGEHELGFLKKGSVFYRICFRVFRPLLRAAIGRRLLRSHSSGRYDLIFITKTLEVRPRVLTGLKERNRAKLFCYYPDNPLDDNPAHCNANSRGIIPECDVFFIFAKFMVPSLVAAGARRVEFLPFAWDPGLHHPVILTGEEQKKYQCQLAFVGAYSPDRAQWFKHLLDHDLAIWGPGWKQAIRLDQRFAGAVKGKSLVGEDFCKAYVAAEIGLNIIQSCHGGDGHNMRTFEAIACGGFVMSNRTSELVELFEEDREIVCFSTPEELREKVSYYLAHPEERAAIAAKGWKRIQSETYCHRARRILDILDEELSKDKCR